MSNANNRMADARNVAEDAKEVAKDMARDAKDMAENEIASLRAKVEALMAERVSPALSGIAERAETLAHDATETVKRQSDSLAGAVRSQPFAAVGAAALAGIAIGLLIRR